jgi:rhodanese-related sulfurtransferase
MKTPGEIIEAARDRGRTAGLPYAGAVSPEEAYILLQMEAAAKLIDVRTNAERDWVGKVTLPEAKQGSVEWTLYPGGSVNPDFIQQLGQQANKDDVLLFLCRSGVRSRHAAKLATENGYLNAYDILEGFEGDKDADGHRKTVGGWCKTQLPWTGA